MDKQARKSKRQSANRVLISHICLYENPIELFWELFKDKGIDFTDDEIRRRVAGMVKRWSSVDVYFNLSASGWVYENGRWIKHA